VTCAPDSIWQYCVAGEWKYCNADTAAIGVNAGTPVRLVDLPGSTAIRFVRMERHTLAPMGINNRRLSAARRAIQKQRDREGMFADALTFDTPEDRIARTDAGHIQAFYRERARRAEAWREARRRLRHIQDGWRRYIVATFNTSGMPKEPAYLMCHIHSVTREVGI
jgi:hypothetical protein